MPLIYGEEWKKTLVRFYKEIKEFLKNKSPALLSALFSKYKDIFKRQKDTAFVSLLYLLILIIQLMTLLRLYYSNEIPALPVVNSSSQNLEKRYLLEIKPQRSQSWSLAV